MTSPTDSSAGAGTAPAKADQPTLAPSDEETQTPTSTVHAFPAAPPKDASVSKQDVTRIFDPEDPLPIARCFLSTEYQHQELGTLNHFNGQFYAWRGTHYSPFEEQTIRAQLYD